MKHGKCITRSLSINITKYVFCIINTIVCFVLFFLYTTYFIHSQEIRLPYLESTSQLLSAPSFHVNTLQAKPFLNNNTYIKKSNKTSFVYKNTLKGNDSTTTEVYHSTQFLPSTLKKINNEVPIFPKTITSKPFLNNNTYIKKSNKASFGYKKILKGNGKTATYEYYQTRILAPLVKKINNEIPNFPQRKPLANPVLDLHLLDFSPKTFYKKDRHVQVKDSPEGRFYKDSPFGN